MSNHQAPTSNQPDSRDTSRPQTETRQRHPSNMTDSLLSTFARPGEGAKWALAHTGFPQSNNN